MAARSERHWFPSARMRSPMLVFQNDLGREEWPVTKKKLARIKAAWRPPR